MNSRLPVCSPADVQRALFKIGFFLERQRGSHRVFVRASDNRTVVLPWHHKDLKHGTLGAIIKSVGLTKEEFTALL